jgi:hypothetical membrane protein
MGKLLGIIFIILGLLVISSPYGVLGFEIPFFSEVPYLEGFMLPLVGIILILIGLFNFRTRPRGPY